MRWNFSIQVKKQGRPSAEEQLQKLLRCGRFFGVQIHCSSCRVCSRLAGRRFTFEDAPRFPLRGCDAAQCSCEYLGVVDPRKNRDRRSGVDRRNAIRLTADRRCGQDRRLGSDNWIGYDF